MALYCKCDIASNREDENDTDPNLPTLYIPLVEKSIEETDCDVVGECHDPGSANSIICSDVRNDVPVDY